VLVQGESLPSRPESHRPVEVIRPREVKQSERPFVQLNQPQVYPSVDGDCREEERREKRGESMRVLDIYYLSRVTAPLFGSIPSPFLLSGRTHTPMYLSDALLVRSSVKKPTSCSD